MVVGLSLGLSGLPLPAWLRPFESARADPLGTLRAILWPRGAPLPALASKGPVLPAPVELATASTTEPSPVLTSVLLEKGLVRPPAQMMEPAETLATLQPAAARTAWELEGLARRLGARHVEIEEGCRSVTAEGLCAGRALDAFFAALKTARAGGEGPPLRIVHLGDSLIASDHITDVIRQRLQARHGAGGAGFLFVDRPTRFSGRAVRTGQATPGWVIDKLTDSEAPAKPLGFSGVAFTAQDKPESAQFDVGRAAAADVFFGGQPKGGDVELLVDGTMLATLPTDLGMETAGFQRVSLPEGARKLSITARGSSVRLYGVALERAERGVTYDSIGLPGATAQVLLRATPEVFQAQLARREPSLVVLQLGGNEALALSKGHITLEEVRASFEELLARVHGAAPKASCLLISPLDAGVRTMGGQVSSRGGTEEVLRVLRQVALDKGCAFWNAFEAMGGPGAVSRWLAAGLMNADLVHPLGRGGDLLGHLFDLALERTRLASAGTGPADGTGLELASASLTRVFSVLRRLETEKEGRLSILQLGASHTASHLFTDVVRKRLADRFGDRGRGYVAAGRPSKRLLPSVRRELQGNWNVPDAVSGLPGQIWGLTGIRAEGEAGAWLEIAFCEGCPRSDVRARVDVHLLEEPAMGQLEVFIDDWRAVRVPSKSKPPTERAARVLSFEAQGPSHVVRMRNAGGGTVKVFGASVELDRPGIAYDALGLPGATVFTLATYEQSALQVQLVARRPDLYVLFFGTNESALPRVDVAAMRRRYDDLFRTLKAAAPQAECLLLGPTDRMEQRADRWVQAPSQAVVIPALRDVARSHGCAFWSTRAAMGGPGAISRWVEQKPPLAHPDRVHLTARGYQVLANAFLDDFLAAYERASASAEAP